MKDFLYDAVEEFFNMKEWGIFFKRILILIVLFITGAIFWIFPLSLFVAPFYGMTSSGDKQATIYKDLEGKTTVMSVRNGLQDLLDEGLVTNFVGVRFWIDNRYYEQIGELEIYRVATNVLENHLARNRGTGGANKNLVQARADIYSDYNQPMFTSYSTRLNQAIKGMDRYLVELKEDKSLPVDKKRAIFIVNSDNLAEALTLLKRQLQTNLINETTMLTEDDKFYRIRGNLIAIRNVLKGIDHDFKDKMIDKTSYEENFIPIMSALDQAIEDNPFIILEYLGAVSRIEKHSTMIAQKLGELRDKLRNG